MISLVQKFSYGKASPIDTNVLFFCSTDKNNWT